MQHLLHDGLKGEKKRGKMCLSADFTLREQIYVNAQKMPKRAQISFTPRREPEVTLREHLYHI